jgi:ankyrin repeat protein
MQASFQNYYEIVKFLIQNNADVNIKNKVFFASNLIFKFVDYLH